MSTEPVLGQRQIRFGHLLASFTSAKSKGDGGLTKLVGEGYFRVNIQLNMFNPEYIKTDILDTPRLIISRNRGLVDPSALLKQPFYEKFNSSGQNDLLEWLDEVVENPEPLEDKTLSNMVCNTY